MKDSGSPSQPSMAREGVWRDLHVSAGSVSDALVMQLEMLITSGRLKVGERLPAERDLAQTLVVSRSSLRQALHELELKKMIDRRPGRGTIVTGSAEDPFGSAFSSRVTVEERTIRDVMDLRLAVEPAIAARAASRVSAAGILRLRTLLEEHASTTERRARGELDRQFHLQLAQATANPLLVSLLQTCTEWMGPVRVGGQSAKRHKVSVAGHKRIVAAMVEKDGAAAEAAMRDHLNEVLESILQEAGRP